MVAPQIETIDEDEAFSAIARPQRTVGFDKLVYLIPDPAATAPEMQERSSWGRMGQMDAISQTSFERAWVGLSVRELF